MRYIYFDNAATSFPKPRSVIREVTKCIAEYCGNPGRGAHSLSMRTLEKIYDTRERVASYLCGSSPENVVFTYNATHALNLAIKGKINHKCHVITSDMEHNSVTRPLAKLALEQDVEVSLFDCDESPEIAIPPLIRADTEFLVTSIASNVTGRIIDVEKLYSVAQKYNLYTIIDASQYLGHKRLDIRKTPFDAICSAGHKALFGIQGTGFLFYRDKEILPTLLEGGSGSDSFNVEMPGQLPERYEAGTVNSPGIISLGAGIEYLEEVSHEYIEKKLSDLTVRLREILDDVGATVYGAENGIGSFNLPRINPGKVSALLDDEGIATRSGFHCAPGIIRKLGGADSGVVRVSLSLFNSTRDLDVFYRALQKIKARH